MKMKSKVNPEVKIAPRVLRVVNEQRTARLAEWKAMTAPSPGMAIESRKLKAKLSKIMDLGDLEKDVAILNKGQRGKFTPVPDSAILQTANPPPPPPVDNHFWWVQTTPWPPSGAIYTNFDNDDLRFYGDSEYDGDSLYQFSVGATADFVIQPKRLPPNPYGRWSSSPAIDLNGYLYGFTGVVPFVLSWGDKWSKCWLHVTQRLFQVPPGNFAHLGQRGHTIELMNLDSGSSWTGRQAPGFIDLPRLDFSLADPAADVFASIDVRFDVQLEGFSGIKFGREPFDTHYVSLKTYQWPAVAV